MNQMSTSFPNRARLWVPALVPALAIAALVVGGGHAQAPPGAGQVSTPGSSVAKPGDTGVRAHTNIQIFRPNPRADRAAASSGGGHPTAGSAAPQTAGSGGKDGPARPR